MFMISTLVRTGGGFSTGQGAVKVDNSYSNEAIKYIPLFI
jgi:hypothetical protein